jgi:hypothetical protein
VSLNPVRAIVIESAFSQRTLHQFLHLLSASLDEVFSCNAPFPRARGRGDGLPQRQTLAARRSDRALGWLGAAGRRAAVSKGHRSSPDSAVVVFDGQCRFQEIYCERSRSRVAYEGREPLTFNDDPGNLRSRRYSSSLLNDTKSSVMLNEINSRTVQKKNSSILTR